MAIKKDISYPKKGMNRDTYPGELSKEEYTFALNANIHDENGNGKVVLQNEPSNIKCSGFKDGYKVVGHFYDQVDELTYFFLTNPTTGFSEIGVISSIPEALSLIPTETTDSKGNITVELETPLEQQPQIGVCSYTTIISDLCGEGSQVGSKCLNFSVSDPFLPTNIFIKHGKRGKTLWFAHKRNPQRYIQLDNLNLYSTITNPCDDTSSSICLDCDKMRVFPLHTTPCITAEGIVTGGALRAGNYEVLLAYSDALGNELTDYSPATQPVRIFDKNNNILDQTLLDYKTNQAIKYHVANTDDDFDYYKIAVVYTSGLDGTKTVYEQGIYPIHQNEVIVYDIENKSKFINSKSIFFRRPFYENAEGQAISNGYLYYYGLTTQRTVNLQPVVNLMGSFAKWSTYMAKESLYQDGAASANYMGYHRNEVQSFAIEFEMDGGFCTPRFPLIARPPKIGEFDEVENVEVDSVNEYNPECFGSERKYRWQFENTATEEGICEIPSGTIPGDEYTKSVEISCNLQNEDGTPYIIDSVTDTSVVIPEGFSDLVAYINNNKQAIIDSTDPQWTYIQNILDNPSAYPVNCQPEFGSNCDESSTLISEEVFATTVENAVITTEDASKDFDNYPEIPASITNCGIFKKDTTTGDIINDTLFESTFMNSGENVYQRNTILNTSCATAINIQEVTSPLLPSNVYMTYKGELNGASTLQQPITADGKLLSKIIVSLKGTGGTCLINIQGTDYLATFSIDIATTVSNFLAFYGTVFGDFTAAQQGDDLVFSSTTNADYFPSTITNVTGDLTGTFDNMFFTESLHSNAIWLKVSFGGKDKKVLQVGNILCNNDDANSRNSIRLSFFDSCSSTTNITDYSTIIEDISDATNTDKIIILQASDFTTDTVYVAIDSPIRSRTFGAAVDVMNTLTPPCNCFNIYQRDALTKNRISFDTLNFSKQQTYSSNCTFVVPKLTNCNAIPYKKGDFGYWQSTEVYPCNKELFDSSELIITPNNVPSSIRADFENYFTTGVNNGVYVLDENQTDFRDKNIRHFKFPDNTVAPFMSDATQDPGDFNPSVIYPIGFNLNPEVIGAFLDIAVKNGLISLEERNKINTYRIYRGDRRIHKSVVAKGLLFDFYKYQEKDLQGNTTDVFYPNYPLNANGKDILNNINHPYSSNSNNFFSFHSPETDYAEYGIQRPSLPREVYVDGYLFGKSANFFDQVADYPTYSLLGQKAYDTATALAWTEVGFELLLQSTNWLVLAGSGGLSAPAAAIIAAAGVIAYTATSIFKAGEYRYRWLETFQNLGKPTNYAYYQATVGHYNIFKPNDLPYQKLRGLTISSYLKEGFKTLADEYNHTTIKINGFDRENLVALNTGAYPIAYRPDYVSYDNSSLNEITSSRPRVPKLIGKSSQITGNAASPYATLIQYNPAQWGAIESITWINTGFCGNLQSYSDCDTVFGGDVFISRHSLKRKLPLFRTNAFGLAPLTPFKHSDYFNINPVDPTIPSSNITDRYFIDYQVNDSNSNFVALILYPGQKSYYNLDDTGNYSDEFYIKPNNKFYLYSYGIPHFLVESEINCNFRYAKREKHENFYPNITDAIEFTQEKNVSIKNPNTFFYNNIYSYTPLIIPGTILPVNYSRDIFDKLNNLSNAIIYSQQDLSEREIREPWRSFKANDFYDFSNGFGKLVSVTPIESSQILVRFENGFTIYGSIDPIRDKLTQEVGNLGSGGIFLGRPISFNTTDIGYAGSQHKFIINSEAGHLWCDAKRGKVFLLDPNGKQLSEISRSQEQLNSGLEKWFKENLPFKILRSFPNLNTDNSYNNVGLTGVWDDRLKRFIITKLDLICLDTENLVEYNGILYDESTLQEIIADQVEDGWVFINQQENILRFQKETEGDVCPCITVNYNYKNNQVTKILYPTGTLNGQNVFDFEIITGEQASISYDGIQWNLVQNNNELAYLNNSTCNTVNAVKLTYVIDGVSTTVYLVEYGVQNGESIYIILDEINGNSILYYGGGIWSLDINGNIASNSEPFGEWTLTGFDSVTTELTTIQNECIKATYDSTSIELQKIGIQNGKNAYSKTSDVSTINIAFDSLNWALQLPDSIYTLPTTPDIPISNAWEYQSGTEYTTVITENCSCSQPNCPNDDFVVNNNCDHILLSFTDMSGPQTITFLKDGELNGRNTYSGTYNTTVFVLSWDGSSWKIVNQNNSNKLAYSDIDTICPVIADPDWKKDARVFSADTVRIQDLEFFTATACPQGSGEVLYKDVEIPLADTTDTTKFKPCTWTVAYNPYVKSWISYYSYKPNYYIGYNDYFQSGKNWEVDEIGVWDHLPFGSSYQVFYGKLYPFIVEYPVITQMVNSQITDIQYWLDVRKYYNRYNFTDIFGIGFNKAYVYNSFQNTGELKLVHQKTNDLRSNLYYPKHNLDNVEILQTEINGRWSFNYLYNTIKNENAGLPIWKEDCAQIGKELDNRLLDYRPIRKDYLRGDYYLVRLVQDIESRFKMLFRWSIQDRDLYND